MNPRAIGLLAIFFLLLSLPAVAQESPSYKLKEHVLNAGGHPSGGTVFSSASHRVSLDAIGEGVMGPGLGSASYRMDAGFVIAYPPPGEVENLLFSDKTTLAWSPEKSVGDYDLYRSGSASAVDACLQSEVAGESATDAESPAVGSGFFYLITAENRLDEEGTKGFRSDGTERANPTPCP